MAVLRMGGMHPNSAVRLMLLVLATFLVYYFTARFAHLVSRTGERKVRSKANVQGALYLHDQQGNQYNVIKHAVQGQVRVVLPHSVGRPNLTDPSEFSTRNFHKLVHLDLKGAPPKLEYLRKIIPRLRGWGATSILIEYEDMFPYWGNLKVLARPNAYNASTIAEIQRLARASDLVVIPLIQTFGHFEFVLKHSQFMHIREDSDKLKNLNPAHKASLEVVSEMIDQVLSMHPNTRYLHIGCDEVYYMGLSRESMKMMREKFFDEEELFLYHVLRVLNYIKDKYPRVKPIMWDDMIRKIDTYRLKKHNLGALVEPMVWLYVPHVERHFQPYFWNSYAGVFKYVWTASAFKGATGKDQYVVDISYHLQNQRDWVNLMNNTHRKYYPQLIFRGIALTGWQRYDHMMPLCELLPVSIPSLVSCLHCINYGGFTPQVHTMVSETLRCKKQLNLSPAESLEDHAKCTFPGSEIYDAVSELKITRLHIEKYANRRVRDHQMKDIIRRRVMLHVRTLPVLLMEVLDQDAIQEFMQDQVIQGTSRLSDIRREAQATLNELYPWMRHWGQT